MRLIDAVALKKKAQMRGHVSKKEMVTVYQMCVSTHDIDNAPTVDAEQVVLCEDCIIKKAVPHKDGIVWRCPHRTGDVKMEGFCESGARANGS